MDQFDIAIVGGGMVGQALAISIAQQCNYRIAIIEPTKPNTNLNKEFHLRVSAITPRSERLLQEIGAWELIERKHVFTDTKVWDQNSHGSLSFSCIEDGLTHLGNIIENDAIQAALYKILLSTNVSYISDKLISIEKVDAGYKIGLEDNINLGCMLLIGADGANSRTRKLAGIGFSDTDYKQHALICNIKSTNSFNDTTWQRFLSDSIVAILPLSDNQASIVWSTENSLAEELMLLSKDDFAKRLAIAVEYRFGDFEVTSEIHSFTLVERSAKEYVKANIALVGDAAHNIHPLAGQGVNLGFADVEELTNQIIASNKPVGDYGVLRKYARSRRLDNELMAKTMTGLNWIYKENNETLRWFRGFGMNLIDDNPSLKLFLQRHAMGD